MASSALPPNPQAAIGRGMRRARNRARQNSRLPSDSPIIATQ